MSIRRQIRDYVFSTLLNFTTFCQLFKENTQKPIKKFILKLKNTEKNGYSKANIKEIVIDSSNSSSEKAAETKESTENMGKREGLLFENKLENELGPLHKFKHTTRDTKFHKPLFLKNRLLNKKKSSSKSFRNKMVLFTDANRIIISKTILKNESDIDRIVIEKSRLKSFYNSNI
jgi:hypothetical protein